MHEPIDISHELVSELLLVVKDKLLQLGLDYFLVGAIARDIQLSAKAEFAAQRKTRDIDIAVLVNAEEAFHTLIEALCATGQFQQVTKNPLKLIFRQMIELDILPFGAIEDEGRMLRLNKNVMLSMEGFSETFPFVEKRELLSGHSVCVCPIEGLILLKLLSNNEDSSRTKDIADIEHIIGVYFDLSADEVYENYMDIMNNYDTNRMNYLELVSARTIGRKMKLLVAGNAATFERILHILSKRPNEIWQAMALGLQD